MTLKEQIDQDFLAAYKAKDEALFPTLRSMKNAIKNFEINSRTEAGESDAIKILKKEAKQRLDAAAEFEKGGRPELAKKEQAEQAIIEQYLPKDLSDAELDQIVIRVVGETGATGPSDMGRVIGAVMKTTNGLADGGRVSDKVRAALSQ